MLGAGRRGPRMKTRDPRNMLNEFLLYTLSYNCTPSSVCVEFLKKLLGERGRRIKQYQRRAVWCWSARKAIVLIVCRMHSRLLQAKRLQGLLGWTENYSAFSCPCLTWLMGVSHPLGHLQELGSGVYHCRACCWLGFDQSSAFVVERRYFISADSKRRWSVQGYCHRTCLPSHSPNKRRTKANDQPNYVLFPPSRLLRVTRIFIIPKSERHHAGLISERFPISSIFQFEYQSRLSITIRDLRKILSIVHLKFMPLSLVIEASPVNIQGWIARTCLSFCVNHPVYMLCAECLLLSPVLWGLVCSLLLASTCWTDGCCSIWDAFMADEPGSRLRWQWRKKGTS